LFHFANVAMLPLLGEKLAQSNPGAETLFMAACIITAQLVMVPMAILVGRKADRWDASSFSLPASRFYQSAAPLYAGTEAVRARLDTGAGRNRGGHIRGAVFIVVADLTKGTGRYNLAQGAALASWGLGAALSNSAAKYIVDIADYSSAFLFLVSCAAAALLLFWTAMPETGAHEPGRMSGWSARKALAPAD